MKPSSSVLAVFTLVAGSVFVAFSAQSASRRSARRPPGGMRVTAAVVGTGIGA